MPLLEDGHGTTKKWATGSRAEEIRHFLQIPNIWCRNPGSRRRPTKRVTAPHLKDTEPGQQLAFREWTDCGGNEPATNELQALLDSSDATAGELTEDLNILELKEAALKAVDGEIEDRVDLILITLKKRWKALEALGVKVEEYSVLLHAAVKKRLPDDLVLRYCQQRATDITDSTGVSTRRTKLLFWSAGRASRDLTSPVFEVRRRSAARASEKCQATFLAGPWRRTAASRVRPARSLCRLLFWSAVWMLIAAGWPAGRASRDQSVRGPVRRVDTPLGIKIPNIWCRNPGSRRRPTKRVTAPHLKDTEPGQQLAFREWTDCGGNEPATNELQALLDSSDATAGELTEDLNILELKEAALKAVDGEIEDRVDLILITLKKRWKARLYDDITINVRSLEALGVKVKEYSVLLHAAVKKRLPDDLVLRYCQQRATDITDSTGRHVTCLCDPDLKPTKGSPHSSSQPGTSEVSVTSAVSNSVETVLLQTATIWAEGETKRRLFRCLLNGGSQRTF
ncbi:hypothetical protein HPB47_028115, partial [Ixodes persulcatus]